MSQINLFKEFEGLFKDKDLPPASAGGAQAGEAPEKNKGVFEYAYSPFALQDAVGEKSMKKMWLEYEKLRLSGIEADELIYKIASKIRDMLAIKKGATKEDLNIKSDYPYNKSKKDSKNWKEEDIKNFYIRLVSVYHRARMGEEELDIALERAVLGI